MEETQRSTIILDDRVSSYLIPCLLAFASPCRLESSHDIFLLLFLSYSRRMILFIDISLKIGFHPRYINIATNILITPNSLLGIDLNIA